MKFIGIMLMVLPLLFVGTILVEGGIIWLGMFILYIIATLCTLVAPIVGVLLYRMADHLK